MLVTVAAIAAELSCSSFTQHRESLYKQCIAEVKATHPFLALGAAAVAAQESCLTAALKGAAGRAGPTGFTAACEASILNVPLFHACITSSLE